MNAYIDTNVLVSYAIESDIKHNDAIKLIDKIKKLKMHVSPLTIFEIYCVIPRLVEGGLQLPKPLQDVIGTIYNLEDKCKFARRLVLTYLNSALNLIIHSDSETRCLGTLQNVSGFDSIETLKIYAPGFLLSHVIRVKTLDIIHLTYAHEYAKKGVIEHFVTLDQNLKKFKDQIEKHFKIKVLNT